MPTTTWILTPEEITTPTPDEMKPNIITEEPEEGIDLKTIEEINEHKIIVCPFPDPIPQVVTEPEEDKTKPESTDDLRVTSVPGWMTDLFDFTYYFSNRFIQDVNERFLSLQWTNGEMWKILQALPSKGTPFDSRLVSMILSTIQGNTKAEGVPMYKVAVTLVLFTIALMLPNLVLMLSLLTALLFKDPSVLIVLLALMIRLMISCYRKLNDKGDRKIIIQEPSGSTLTFPLLVTLMMVFVMQTGYANYIQIWAFLLLAAAFMVFSQFNKYELKSPAVSAALIAIIASLSLLAVFTFATPENIWAHLTIVMWAPAAKHKSVLAEAYANNAYLKAMRDINEDYHEILSTVPDEYSFEYKQKTFATRSKVQEKSTSFEYMSWLKGTNILLTFFKIIWTTVFFFIHQLKRIQSNRGSSYDLHVGMLANKQKAPSLIPGATVTTASNSWFSIIGPDLYMFIPFVEIFMLTLKNNDIMTLVVVALMYLAATTMVALLYDYYYKKEWEQEGSRLTIGPSQMSNEYYFGVPATNAIKNLFETMIKVTSMFLVVFRATHAFCAWYFIGNKFNLMLAIISIVFVVVQFFKFMNSMRDISYQRVYLISLLFIFEFYAAGLVLYLLAIKNIWKGAFFEYDTKKTTARGFHMGNPNSMLG